MAYYAALTSFPYQSQKRFCFSRIRASSSSSAATGRFDLKTLESAIAKKDSNAVKEALDQLSEVGWAKRWSSQPYVSRRTTTLRELTLLGIKNAENLAIPSVRNDAAFLFTVVGITGFLGVLAGQLPGFRQLQATCLTYTQKLQFTIPLPQPLDISSSVFVADTCSQDWGFFTPYLIGSISLVVLAVGSTSPGLAVVAMAGLAAEGLQYDKVVGQSADLFSLQRFINRTKPPLSQDQQQNLTRWAVLFAATLIKNNKAIHEALMAAMSKKATILECIEAIENAA
ncbi:hypothetical protein KPL71_022168 [Citrus sinensis]|uniref:Uncharacterized protein n=1 Tax=Citrus sinensis TaxID=2711 RepID=A0ACB8JKZ8_CITSI|nr:hypothetical protein KPL71_022168 [Citrus sinensis]